MAGGPVTVADQYNTIGDNVRFYQNTELLELNKDRFVGHPVSDKLNDANNQIWYGQMSNGDYVIGLFNRDDNARSVSVNLPTWVSRVNGMCAICGNMPTRAKHRLFLQPFRLTDAKL